MIQRLFATWLVCGAILFAILRSPTRPDPEIHAALIVAQVAAKPASAPVALVASENPCAADTARSIVLAASSAPAWQSAATGAHGLVGPYREGLHPDQTCGGRRLAAAR